MAHADIFERISREVPANKKQVAVVNNTENKMESSIDKKAIETLKILGKQVIEMKELVDEQSKLINALQEELVRLKKRQTESKGDIDLVVIDQRDISKQLRNLKAIVTGEIHVNNRMQHDQVSMHHQDSNPDAIARRFYSNYDQNPLFKNNSNHHEYQGTPPQAARLAPVQQYPQTYSQQVTQPQHKSGIDHSKHAESVAKEFIFGRIPKLLNLE
jgi:hypothetical protein